MHAFDYVVMFLSFVYAAAITHVLACTGDLIIAARRIRFSWLNAGWMLTATLVACAWWIGMWDMRRVGVWAMPEVGFLFTMAAVNYLLVRMVCPRVPAGGEIDLVAFHATEGRKYLVAYAVIAGVTVISNWALGEAHGLADFLQQNLAVLPMSLAAGLAAVFIRNRWVQWACLAVELAAWAWYFGALQSALAG